jgi:hypothetical protein
VGKFAATDGKMACGLKIVMPDGGRVSYARAAVAILPCGSFRNMGIGYLMLVLMRKNGRCTIESAVPGGKKIGSEVHGSGSRFRVQVHVQVQRFTV